MKMISNQNHDDFQVVYLFKTILLTKLKYKYLIQN